MQLDNETPAIAHLHAVHLLEPQWRTVVIVKMTYSLGQDGALTPAPDPMPLVSDVSANDFGSWHGELFFRKRGVDLCVLGTARYPYPVEEARLRLSAGNFMHELKLYGDRVWLHAMDQLVPSRPIPFRELPVSYARAYGGTAEVYGEDVPWVENPTGRGYYETAAQAAGRPLPNIELPDAPTRRWDRAIPVAGWAPYPMWWSLRASKAVKVNPDSGAILDVSPELFNHAHPSLIVPSLAPGARFRVDGMGPNKLEFAVPITTPEVRVEVAGSSITVRGELDGVFLWTDAMRVVVTWRARFAYPFRPEETRRATLRFA